MSERCHELEKGLAGFFGPPKRKRIRKSEPEPMSQEERAAMVERVRNQPRHPSTCASVRNKRTADCDCGARATQEGA